jgi:eukaryotic-like serine/threonine-protein kinase
VTSERSSGCLEHETLVALIAGQLLLDQHPQIEAHLAECSDCQNVVAAAAAGLESSQGGAPSERAGLPKPGDLIAGKYRIERVVGRGGMGTVFAARHGELGQSVAIKVLHSVAPTAAARFQREAKISAHLSSEHIARVFDFGTSEGVPFLVMEYLAGEDLSSVIARGTVRPDLAVEYAQQICAALSEAHAAGIVHRDLKPSNVFVVQRPDGSPCLKILDFGISKRKLGGTDEKSQDLTNAHVVLGSPAYMSPEQLRHSKDVDARGDIWSLGILMYELLTGKRPFQAWSLAALSAAIAADSPRPPSALNPNVPGSLDRIVMRCLKKDASERFASAAEVSEALRRAVPRARRLPLARWVVGAGTLALASVAFVRYAAHSTAEREIAPVLPTPSPEPGPRLGIRCDPPYPLGDFRFDSLEAGALARLSRPWPIVRVCTATETDPIRVELAAALAPSWPLSRAALDPPNPCYRLGVRSVQGEIDLELARAERCSVQLTLRGSGCELVRSIEVAAPGLEPVTVSSGPSEDVVTNEGSRCRRRVELPFEAYGKSLHVRLTPATFSAADLVFSGDALELPVKRQKKKRSRPERLEPCVPPEYCRR